MEYKLEITMELEKLALTEDLDDRIAVLNMPVGPLCGKMSEKVIERGTERYSCEDCIARVLLQAKGLSLGEGMSEEQAEEIIDFFAEHHGTRIITVNGRGDPFHPNYRRGTLAKIRHAAKRGMQSYVFTAGNALDDEIIEQLALHKVNVMISEYGNKVTAEGKSFLDADFFSGRAYSSSTGRFFDANSVATNLRQLIARYQQMNDTPLGATRLGMNYVVTEEDIIDSGMKLSLLKEEADRNRIFLICNTPFDKNQDESKQNVLERMAHKYSSFHLQHSTLVDGYCRMGVGAITVEHDGTVLDCPYKNVSDGEGNFFELLKSGRIYDVVDRFRDSRVAPCVLRTHQKLRVIS